MFMHTKLLLLLLWMLPAVSVLAQTKPSSIRVIYAGGDVSHRSATKGVWKPISMGDKPINLAPADNIRLGNRAILVMKGSGDRPIVITSQTGIVNVGTSMRAPATEQSTVLGDYFKYLWYNLRHEHETVDTYAKAYMKRKGVVSRGEGCTPPLMLTPDYGAALATDSTIAFAWKRDFSASRYILSIYDNYDPNANTLYTTETADTTLNFTLNKPFIQKEVMYYWSAYPTGSPNCARFTFSLPKTETFRTIEAQAAELDRQMTADASMSAFMKAALYERNNYYSEAYRAYSDATKLAPDNALYRDGLTLFLARRGMVAQAERVQAMK